MEKHGKGEIKKEKKEIGEEEKIKQKLFLYPMDWINPILKIFFPT